MRKVLIVIQDTPDAEALARQYSIGEIISGIPPVYANIVTFLPAIVVESATNLGKIVGVYNPDTFTPEQLAELQDLPATIPTKPPNPNQFNLAIFNLIGLTSANSLLTKYPLYSMAISAGNWPLAWQVLQLVVSNKDISQDIYNRILGFAPLWGIPLPASAPNQN